MESIDIFIDDGTGVEFDKIMSESKAKGLRDGGDLAVISKNAGTESGRDCVMLTFTVEAPRDSGKTERVQTVVTMRNFLNLCRVFLAKYGDDGRPR